MLACELRQLPPIQSGQPHVRDHQVQWRVGHQNRNRGLPVAGLDAGVTKVAQHLADQQPHREIVLHQQDRLAVSLRRRRVALCVARVEVASVSRQEHGHMGAFALPALDPDIAAALLDETIDHREPKAGPFAERFRRVEGLEHLAHGLGADPDPGVADPDHRVVAGIDPILARSLGRGDFDLPCRDGKPTTVRHGIARVDREVDDGALELIGVRQRRPYIRLQVHRHLEALAERPVQEILDAADELVRVEGLRIERLAAREGEQAMRQGRRAVRRSRRGVHEPLRVVVFPRRQPAPEDVHGADDAGQHIVEIVREAPGELADGLHFLRLPERLLGRRELFLAPEPFGDVVSELEGSELAPGGIAQGVELVLVKTPVAGQITKLLDGCERLSGQSPAPQRLDVRLVEGVGRQ